MYWSIHIKVELNLYKRPQKAYEFPDSKVHGANMEPTSVLSAPNGPHVGPTNLAIRVHHKSALKPFDCRLMEITHTCLNYKDSLTKPSVSVYSIGFHDDVIKWNIFRVTGHLWGEFAGHRWLPRTKASDAEIWCFLWSALVNGWVNNGECGDLRRYPAYYDVTVMLYNCCYISMSYT